MKTNKELIDSKFLMFQETCGQGGIGSLPMDRVNGDNLPYLIWCTADGWDHVLASYSDRFFYPEEIELLKRFFFRPEEQKAIIVEQAVLNDPRPYGISLWRQNRKDAQRPPVYGHIPHSLLKESWELKIHPAYHMAVRMQAMGNKISPDAYIASLEKQTDRLFSSNAPLSMNEKKLILTFYKKPSVEKYFLTLIRQEQARQHSLADIPYTASKKTGNTEWKVSFDPLLYNAVTYQANANNMSPSDYIRQIQNHIDSAYNPLVVRDENAKEIETLLRAEFKNKPTVQQVFMYLMLSAEKEANAGRV